MSKWNRYSSQGEYERWQKSYDRWRQRQDELAAEDGPPPPGPAYDAWKMAYDAKFGHLDRHYEAKAAEELTAAIARNVQELNGKAPIHNAIAGASVELTRKQPRATLIVQSWELVENLHRWREDQPRRVHRHRERGKSPQVEVSGVGARKRRTPAVELVVLGDRGDPLADFGITCDGTWDLPVLATHVRCRLGQRTEAKSATVAIITGRRDIYAEPPRGWEVREVYKPPKEWWEDC